VCEKAGEAANRADCFAKCKAQGIVPIAVESGSAVANKGGHGTGSKPKAPNAKLLLVSVALVAAGAAIWFWPSGKDAVETGKKVRDGREEQRQNARKKAVGGEVNKDSSASSGAREAVASEKPESDVKEGLGGPELPVAGSATNTPVVPVLPPSAFNNASDQVLAMIASDDGMGSAPPIPISRDIESEFRQSLKQEIKILETDDEKTRQLKEAVIAARAEMKKMIDSGMTVSQVLAEYQKLANENAEVRNKAMLELKEIMDSGDIKGAVEYKRKINIALQQMGIAELSIPVTEEEKTERAIARRERMLKKRERQAAAQNGGTGVQ
jgi:hypothetical protein